VAWCVPCCLWQLVPFGCTTCPFTTLFSELFFWVSHCHSVFRKTLLNEKFASKYYHVEKGINNKQISTKRQETTVTMHSNTWVYFVQSLIRLFCDFKTLKKLGLKVLYTLCVSLTHCHIPRRGSHHRLFRDTICHAESMRW